VDLNYPGQHHAGTFRDQKEVILVRNNYSYQKRQRELAKKKKKEEKKRNKLDRKNTQANADLEQASD